MTRFPRGGGTNILQRFQGGGYLFFTRKERRTCKMPLLRHSRRLNAPPARFAPAALKSFQDPGGGGFLTETLKEA